MGDALRGAKMFERVGVPVFGVVENMSAFADPETGHRLELFSSGGGQRLAEEIGVPLLGSVPLQPQHGRAGRRGPAHPGRAAPTARPPPASATSPGSLRRKTAGRSAALPILRN